MTDAERVLWSCLRGKKLQGRKFRRQESIGAFIVDFYCYQEKLIIEVDGNSHNHAERKHYDAKRTTFLKTNGYKVIRFSNKEVFMDIKKVLKEISNAFKEDLP